MIGGGVMGEAMISCLLQNQVFQPQEIAVSDLSESRLGTLAAKYGILTYLADSNSPVWTADTLLLAIKPQIFHQEFTCPFPSDRPSPGLVISIMAGIPLAQLQAAFPTRAVIRAMPNTPAQVGCGVTAFALGSNAQPAHCAIASQIFGAVGEVVEVKEAQINAITGLSGSGPAFIAIAIEAMADAGVAMGLARTTALQLAIQTVLGTATLIKQTALSPSAIKDQVASPGGTTIAGIRQLERLGLRTALIEAVCAATARADELDR
ncbi:MAG: pyrroline-5-carboxylate reductase [Pseudanabaenaceae cyanobacterium bins.68]|nr:pyrroline-5-carboxylate reductase [Pseudanabaenaceae cyanobacterium bins.68]